MDARHWIGISDVVIITLHVLASRDEATGRCECLCDHNLVSRD
jgi:hypothetical protein